MRTVWNEDGVFPKRKGGDVQGVSTGFLFGADLKEAFSLESGPLYVNSKKMYQMKFFVNHVTKRRREMYCSEKNIRWFFCVLLTVLFLAFPLSGFCKDKIVIGTAISLSGPYAPGAAMTQIPNYHL